MSSSALSSLRPYVKTIGYIHSMFEVRPACNAVKQGQDKYGNLIDNSMITISNSMRLAGECSMFIVSFIFDQTGRIGSQRLG
jgi:hypothetical protein